MNEKLCPKMEETLTMLGKKWTGVIIYTLLYGPKKFSDMEKYITGLSARMLSVRLKELENEGIIKKNVYSDEKVHIEYELTRKGIDFSDMFKKINEWNNKWS